MMNEQTIREQFLKIVPVLTSWGQYVQTCLSQLTCSSSPKWTQKMIINYLYF